MARKRVSDQALVQAILFMAVVSFFLGKAALNGDEKTLEPQKAA